MTVDNQAGGSSTVETKLPYATPELAIFGSVRNLTGGSASSNGDQGTTGKRN